MVALIVCLFGKQIIDSVVNGMESNLMIGEDDE